jgi:protein kinase A
MDSIVEIPFEEGKEFSTEEEEYKPALYIVRQGNFTICSKGDDGEEITKEVSAGEVFGDDGDSRFSSRRRGGFTATAIGRTPSILAALSLDDLENAQEIEEEPKEVWVGDSIFQKRRAAVRMSVQSDIRLEDLERISLLGEGQFGEVYLVAADVFNTGIDALKQKFALKSQFKTDDIRDNATESIKREIEMIETIQHPGIVDLVNTYEDVDSIYMLMGLIGGGELWNVIHKEEADGNWVSGISEDHAKFYTLIVADTLAYMHSQQYVYRDLKPENVMIDAEGYPIIVDFGFAKYCPDKTYTFCGTPNYVAPEIVRSSGHNAGVDNWALGVMLYEMIAGENPFYFDGMDQVDLYESICHEKYYPFPTKPSKELVDLVNGLLEKDPAQRLGMLVGGSKDILQHKWFDGLDLDKVRARQVKAPWIPPEEEEDFGDEEEDVEGDPVPTEDKPISSLMDVIPPDWGLPVHEEDEEEEENDDKLVKEAIEKNAHPAREDSARFSDATSEGEHASSPISPIPSEGERKKKKKANGNPPRGFSDASDASSVISSISSVPGAPSVLSPFLSPGGRKKKIAKAFTKQEKDMSVKASKDRRDTISGAMFACLDLDDKDLDF